MNGLLGDPQAAGKRRFAADDRDCLVDCVHGSNVSLRRMRCQTLPCDSASIDTLGMNSAERMREKLGEVLRSGDVSQSDIARACNVTRQSVNSWKTTGRIDKRHLPTLARLSGRPLTWWLDADEPSPRAKEVNALLSQRGPTPASMLAQAMGAAKQGVLPSAYPEQIEELIALYPLFSPMDRATLDAFLLQVRDRIAAEAGDRIARARAHAQRTTKAEGGEV